MKNNELTHIKYSVIILLEEKSEDLVEFIVNINEIFLSTQESFEIIIIANGFELFLRSKLIDLHNSDLKLKAFSLSKKATQATCLKAGFNESSGEIIVLCGSYQQITKKDFRNLLNSFDNETDMVTPWRQQRVDPILNQFQSKVFNSIVRKITKYDIHDFSCTVKIFRREVLENTDLYGNMCRFLPIIASQKGFKNKEVKCRHYQERGKTGLYSINDYITRIIDIFTLFFNTRFTRKPLRFFSTIGAAFILAGLLIAIIVLFQKIFVNYSVGGRPVLLLGILFMVLGIQATSVGLLGEIIAFTHGRQRTEYTIEKKI